MKYSYQFYEKLDKAEFKLNQMIEVNKETLSESLRGTLNYILDTVRLIKSKATLGKEVDNRLKQEFKSILNLSVKMFEGNSLDELLWDIYSEL